MDAGRLAHVFACTALLTLGMGIALGAGSAIVIDDCEQLSDKWNPSWIRTMAGGELSLRRERPFRGKGFVRWTFAVEKADRSQRSVYHTVPFGDWEGVTSVELAVRCADRRHGDLWMEVYGSPFRKHAKILERREGTDGWKPIRVDVADIQRADIRRLRFFAVLSPEEGWEDGMGEVAIDFDHLTLAGRAGKKPPRQLWKQRMTVKGDPIIPDVRASCRDGNILVDGLPTFVMGVDRIVHSVANLADHHVNALFMWVGSPNILNFAPQARAHNLLVLGYTPYQWSEKRQREHCLALAKTSARENLLGVLVGDDIKDYDKVRLTAQRWKAWAPGVLGVMSNLSYVDDPEGTYDLGITYNYPLFRYEPAHYRQLLEANYAKAARGPFVRGTWVQVHQRDPYAKRYIRPLPDGRVTALSPDAEHIRWITYEAAATGAKAILTFTADWFREDWFGKERFAEYALLCMELSEVLGELLGSGRVGQDLTCSDGSVFARSIVECITPSRTLGRYFKSRGQTYHTNLILLIKEKPVYKFHVDEATEGPFTVRMPWPKERLACAWRGGRDSGQRLSVRRDGDEAAMELPGLELTGAVVVSEDLLMGGWLGGRVAALRPDSSRFALEVLEGRLAKIEWVLESLERSGVDWRREEQDLLGKCHRDLTQARNEHAQRLFAPCFTRCRQALRALRGMQFRRWESVAKGTEAYQTIGQDVRDDAKVHYTHHIASDGVVKPIDFYTFPQHFGTRHLRDHGKTGKNLIGNPGFESPAGWYKQADLTHDTDEARSGWQQSTEVVRTGERSARLFSLEPKMHKGVVTSWVTYAMIRQMTVPLEPGKQYKAWAWVNVPADFTVGEPNRWNYARGVLLGLTEYSADGKMLSFHRELAQPRKTAGWQLLQLFYRATDPSVRYLRLRLGISCVGEAYIDDVGIAEVTVEGPDVK